MSKSKIRCLGEINELIDTYDKLCASASVDIFRDIFSDCEDSRGINRSDISRNLETIDTYLPLQDRLLECLVESKYITKDGNFYKSNIDFDKIPDLSNTIESMSSRNQEYIPFMNFFAYCVSPL